MKKPSLMFVLAALIAISCHIKAQSPIRIVCIGNSITEGWGLFNGSVEAYPMRLAVLLGPGYSVMNFGASGKTMFKNVTDSYWTTGRLEAAVNFDPHIVLIKLGTNDSDPFRWDLHKQEFYSDYLSMISEFRKGGKNPIFFVSYCAPIFRETQQAQNIKNEVIPLLDSVIKTQGTYLIDYYNNLIEDGEFFPDGVHPNAKGARKMARIAFDAISASNKITPRMVLNNDTISDQYAITVNAGDTVILDPQPADGSWNWTGTGGFTSNERLIRFDSIQMNQGGFYIATYTSPEGLKSIQAFIVTIDGCSQTPIIPYVNAGQGWTSETTATVEAGGNVSFGPQPFGGSWSWTGPDGFVQNSREFSLYSLKNRQEGIYTATYYNEQGCITTEIFTVTVTGEDVCRANEITPYLQINNGAWNKVNSASVNPGSSITFGPQASNVQGWLWSGPNGFTANTRECTLNNIQKNNEGEYIATITYDDTCSSSISFSVTVNEASIIGETGLGANAQTVFFPNPATDKIVLANIPANSAVSVYDLAGQVVLCMKTTDEHGTISMDVGKLKPGAYFIKMGDSAFSTLKLLKL